jgi:hypothetical protein
MQNKVLKIKIIYDLWIIAGLVLRASITMR